MQFYPRERVGFELSAENAAALQLTEAFEDPYEDFSAVFSEKYGCDEPEVVDTTYERGGYIQGLEGWDWDKEYIAFDPDYIKLELETALEEAGIVLEHASYSQLC